MSTPRKAGLTALLCSMLLLPAFADITGIVTPPGAGGTIPGVVTTSGCSGDTTGVLDSAALQAAINSLTISGGTLQLAACQYYLATPLIPKSGVSIVGQLNIYNYTTNTAQIPDSNVVLTNAGGTIFNCKAGSCFQWNKTVLGVPGSGNAFVISGPTNYAIKNIGFTNCNRAIDAGNTNNPAGWYGEFENLSMGACTGWGFWITNFQHDKFRRIYTFAGATGGQWYGNDVPSSILQPGNSVWEDIYSVIPSNNGTLSRGIVFNVAQGIQNEGFIYRIQSNRFNTIPVTQAATMANATANITVTDGTKFAVDLPVTFSATVNGFTVGKIYFVLTNAANVITVSLTQGGAAVVATGSTAVNVTHQGFPALEVVALAGASINAHEFRNIDTEGGGTTAVLLQNTTASIFSLSQFPSIAQASMGVTGRSVIDTQIFSPNGTNTDFDNAGNGASVQYYGARQGTSVGYMGAGIWFDLTSTNTVFALGTAFEASGTGDLTLIGGNKIVPSLLGQRTAQSGTATPTLGDGNMSVVYTNTNSGTTITLPTVSATNVTNWITIFNTTAAAYTITGNGVQTFNNVAGRTTITLNPNASVRIACSQFSGVFGYVIEGGSSAMVAGVISAPT